MHSAAILRILPSRIAGKMQVNKADNVHLESSSLEGVWRKKANLLQGSQPFSQELP